MGINSSNRFTIVAVKNIIVSNELFATEKDMNLIKVADTTKSVTRFSCIYN